MNSQLNGDVTRTLRRLLKVVRLHHLDHLQHGLNVGRCWGFISALRDAGLISLEESFRLDRLVMSAAEHSGRPFPDEANLGPVMPDRVWLERKGYLQPAVKPSAQVPADEHSGEVSAPAARLELRLFCLLVKGRDGTTRSLPVHTMRPMPPRVGPVGRWALAGDPAFVLRETRAERPAPEVLERYLRLGQANALRPDSRTVRVGGVSHG